MKKLLIVTNHSYMLWQFRRELIQNLLEKYEVSISTPFVGHEQDFANMGCRMIRTDVDRRGINPATDAKLISTYARMLKEEKPDCVVTYSIKPNVYMGTLCRFHKIPYYVNVQGLGTAFQKKGLAQVVTGMYRFGLKAAKTVFFENEGNAQLFRQKKITPKEQQTILSGAGINLEFHACKAYPQNKEIHFLYLGRIMKEKGIDELFLAFKKLKETYGEKVVLDLVGFFEDEYKAQVEELVKQKIAVFHGFQEDPRPFYAQADCVVLPSYHEGMSNVLLEAAAAGRPLITSDVPGCREAVEDGKTGFLCEVKNWESLYKKMDIMTNLAEEERKNMGLAGRRKMEKEFDRNQVIKRTVEKILESGR